MQVAPQTSSPCGVHAEMLAATGRATQVHQPMALRASAPAPAPAWSLSDLDVDGAIMEEETEALDVRESPELAATYDATYIYNPMALIAHAPVSAPALIPMAVDDAMADETDVVDIHASPELAAPGELTQVESPVAVDVPASALAAAPSPAAVDGPAMEDETDVVDVRASPALAATGDVAQVQSPMAVHASAPAPAAAAAPAAVDWEAIEDGTDELDVHDSADESAERESPSEHFLVSAAIQVEVALFGARGTGEAGVADQLDVDDAADDPVGWCELPAKGEDSLLDGIRAEAARYAGAAAEVLGLAEDSHGTSHGSSAPKLWRQKKKRRERKKHKRASSPPGGGLFGDTFTIKQDKREQIRVASPGEERHRDAWGGAQPQTGAQRPLGELEA